MSSRIRELTRVLQPLQTKIERQRVAAKSDDLDARYKLARLLTDGTEEQKSEAFALARKLADAGHLDSKFMVGWCCGDGCGVKQDKKNAFECYREAAELGHLKAQLNVAHAYRWQRHRAGREESGGVVSQSC